MGSLKTLVIIPAFQEEGSIGAVIADVKSHAPGADIVVVDDGSGDATSKVAASAGVTVIRQSYNIGIGGTMQTGYKYAMRNGYEVAVQVDGDGQHPADMITELTAPIERGEADVVVGSRFLGVGDYRPSRSRSAGIALFSRLVSFIIKEKVTDTTSGFRAAGREVIAYYTRNYPDDYPEVEALVLLHKKGFRIREIPVNMTERTAGRSSITPLRSVYYMVKVLFAIFVDLLRRPDK